MAARAIPLHLQAMRANPALPLSGRAGELLLRDLQRGRRRYLRPIARVLSAAAVWSIVLIKRVLSFQFSSHGLLDTINVWFLRRFVSPEGGELLRRHFIVETNLIHFVARNSGLAATPEPELRPTRFADLMGHAVITHDVNMYRLVIDVGNGLRACGRFRPEATGQLDFSMLEVPQIEPDRHCRRILNLDLSTALYFMVIPFVLLTSEDVYEQAVNSFQLDGPLLSHLADITGDKTFLTWSSPCSLAWLELRGDVPRALYLHAVLHEYAHTHLELLAGRPSSAWFQSGGCCRCSCCRSSCSTGAGGRPGTR